MKIPEKGLPREQILAALQGFKSNDMDWQAGKVWCDVYDPGDEATRLLHEAYRMYLTENGLDPTVFPSMLKLETEVVRMVASLLRGDENVVGHVTTGGTESIILAVKTARDKARAERPEITAPEMVLPITAHASFHKAAHYLGIKPVVTAIDPQTFRANVEAMRESITPNTILLVGSAPNYSQGVVDPIAEIGQLVLENDLPLHVDGCVGGIHLAYMRKMGYPVPAYDFTVPGVTSISADLHKYGYAAKGASVILYKNKDLRRYQIFACTDTTAYTLINPTVLSTKSGGPLAGAWAILHYLGDEGYMHIVETVQRATEQLIEGVNAIPGLRVLGEPNMCMFSFASENVNAFQLADEMDKRGWYIQGQFATEQSPRSLHVSVMYGNAPNADAMLADLRGCVEKLEKETPIDSAAVQQLIAFAMQSPSPEQAILELADSAGIAGTELPDELAYINEILEALPDEIANKLLIDFFNDLYV